VAADEIEGRFGITASGRLEILRLERWGSNYRVKMKWKQEAD
jgi:hypothetical protein